MDKQRDALILEEFKRLGDKVAVENSQMLARLDALEKINHEEKLKTLLDAKLDKEEFANFVSLLQEETISPMQKEIDKCKKDI